jgi:GTP cyclohydrolase I
MDFDINQPVPFDTEKTALIADHYKQIIKLLGEDVEREGLIKTPERVHAPCSF